MIEEFRAVFAPPRHLILLVAALWFGLWLAEKRTEQHAVSKEQLNNIVFYSLFGHIIGGRLLFALTNLSAFIQSPLSLFSPNPDLFDPASGMLVAVLVGFVYGKREKLLLWNTLDSLTPIFALLMIGLHLAHLAAGTAFGSPTTLPWGMELWNATRHPSQVYGLLASLLILGLLWLNGTSSPPGIYFLNFLAWTAGSHLFLEAFRGDSTLVAGGLRAAQLWAWMILTAALLASESIRQRKQGH